MEPSDTGAINTVIAIIIALGGLSGVILYLLNRKNTNATVESLVTKSEAEVNKIRREIEDEHIQQLGQWIADLRDAYNARETLLKEKTAELMQKDVEFVELHRKWLHAVRILDEIDISLRRYNDSTKKLFSRLGIPYWEANKDGSLEYVNGAWRELFGLEAPDALDKGWQSVVLAEDLPQLKITWSAALTDLNDEPIRFRIQNPVTGEVLHLEALYSAVLNPDGNVHKIIGATIKLSI